MGLAMALSDAKIRSSKPGLTIKKLSDGKGLQLCVMPTGGKLWRLAYRHEGKQRTLSIGPYPAVGLSKARDEAEKARGLLVSRIDPYQQKRADKLENTNKNARTFGLIADELLAKKKREGKAERTIEKLRWLFGLAKPFIGERPISEIAAPEILATLRNVENKGRLETAKRLRAVIGEVFRYAIATGRAETDPTFALRGALTAPEVRPRAAIIDAAGLGGLLRAIDGFEGQPATKSLTRNSCRRHF